MYSKNKKNPKKLQIYAKKLIPGISQLFGKRPEMHLPGGNWPTYYSKAKGVQLWGLDNKKFLDFTMVGAGGCVLGYSDKDINKTAIKALKSGSLTTLNVPEEVELAEMLIKIHPWADNVRYARTGGESMSMAIRIARAYTKKEKILFCGYHGWQDWYVGITPRSKGVPNSISKLTHAFTYNNIGKNIRIDTSHPEELTRNDVDTLSLLPAYVLSELKIAFLIVTLLINLYHI